MDLGSDVLQVGLTEDADDKLRLLRAETSQYFTEDAHVYRIGVGVALALGSEITEAMKRQSLKNKFRTVRESETTGDLMPRLDSGDRRLAGLISVHRPEWAHAPYRHSQYLAVIGINYLHQELIERGKSLYEALSAIQSR